MNQSASKDGAVSKNAKHHYHIAMMIYAVVFLVSTFVSTLLTKQGPSSAWWHIPLALVPLIPIFFALRAFLRFFSRLDELQRRIQLEALALSFGATCLVTWSYGLLEYVGVPGVSWIWVPPIMLVLWDISVRIASRWYQ